MTYTAFLVYDTKEAVAEGTCPAMTLITLALTSMHGTLPVSLLMLAMTYAVFLV